MEKIRGEITPRRKLTGALSEAQEITATMGVPIFADYPVYDGDYTVTPKADEATVLETQGKVMADDVTVIRIPYYETTNETGTTVYIASEV